MTSNLILDIKRNSLDDGPGVRTLVFFKGCPLSCVWCQNPESQSHEKEIKFEAEYCTNCGKCINACEENAIDFNNKYRINRNNCTLCGKCVDTCPNQAYSFVGKEYSIKDLVQILLKDKIFYDNTGGGVTFSGGEPTMHVEYLHELLKELKKYSIHTCLETCGFFNMESFELKILPYLDLIFYDLKLYDDMDHKKYCGISNELILNNFKYLIGLNKIEVLPRIPLIPVITITEKNLKQLRNFLEENNIKKVELLPYNPLWITKPSKIGQELKYSHSESLTIEEKHRIKEIFSNFDHNDF